MRKKSSMQFLYYTVFFGAVFYFWGISFSLAQQCTYPATTFTSAQVIDLEDRLGVQSELEDYFEKEYLVVDMSLSRCQTCVDFALQHNNDQDFKSRVSGESSCHFITLVESGMIIEWLNKINGPQSFI